jgi:hypothetical protein
MHMTDIFDDPTIDAGYIPLLEQLRQSPTLVLKQSVNPNGVMGGLARPEQLKVVQVPVVPNDDCIYWIAGVSVTPCGLRIPSVFLTCEGGSIVFQTFWYVGGRWHYHHDTRAHDALEQDYDSLIPFDEEFAVPTAYEVEDE